MKKLHENTEWRHGMKTRHFLHLNRKLRHLERSKFLKKLWYSLNLKNNFSLIERFSIYQWSQFKKWKVYIMHQALSWDGWEKWFIGLIKIKAWNLRHQKMRKSTKYQLWYIMTNTIYFYSSIVFGGTWQCNAKGKMPH